MLLRSAVIIAAAAALAASSPASAFKVSLGKQTPGGNYDILVDGKVWFPAAGSVSVHHAGKTFSSSGAAAPLRALSKDVESTGRDGLGRYVRRTSTWELPGTSGSSFTTTATVYDQAVVFTQSYPEGAKDTATGDRDNVVSAFPSFAVGNYSDGRRGYVQYSGPMLGSGFHVGEWDSTTCCLASGLSGTGPVVIFSDDRSVSAVISPFNNHMAANQVFDSSKKTLSYGIMGNVTSIPKGYELSTIVSFAEGSANSAMMRWGDLMLARSGKVREEAWARDFSLQWLGYSTDNGAFYYYVTEPNKTYEQTMVDVKEYADSEQIPYRYWLADSWWYFKGDQNGVKNWTAMPSIFPDGMAGVYEKLGWIVQGHNRYWSANTDYAKQNGGKWEFLIDDASQYALPLEQGFWDWLMMESRKWGLAIYEQDWLYTEFNNFLPLTKSATLGQTWLMQMGEAAARNGLAIQYCMSYPRHMLASTEIPAVTQARASDDYHPGRDQWSPMGTTSLFAWAIGVAPSKDNYWSTSVQNCPKYGNDTEPHNRLQAAVITLSKGPVAPSDAIGKSDRGLIMRSAMEDGTLLQPSRPATMIDAMFERKAFGTSLEAEEVWFAESEISGRRYGVLFAARLGEDVVVDLEDDLGFGNGALSANVVGVESKTPDTLYAGIGDKTITLKACSEDSDFALINLAAREDNGWALLGEVKGKWVGVSPARFESISSTDVDVSVTVRGSPGEKVTLSFASPQMKVVDVSCSIGEGSRARISASGSCISF